MARRYARNLERSDETTTLPSRRNCHSKRESALTRAAKIVYSLALFAGFSAGALLGFQRGTSNAEFYREEIADVSPLELRQFAILQSLHANPDQGRTALLTYLDLLEQLETVRPDRKQLSELAECYVRLAILEKQSGNEAQAHAMFERARSLEGSSKAAKSSDTELENAILRLDQLKEQHGLMY